MPDIASRVTFSDCATPGFFLFLWLSFNAPLSPELRGVQENALRASFCKLLRLLLNDDRVDVAAFDLCFGLVPETKTLESLAGEVMLIAIDLAAYAIIVVLSLKRGNSLRICKKLMNQVVYILMDCKSKQCVQDNVPEMQIAAASASVELLQSTEGVHVAMNIFAAMATAKKLKHEDLKPMRLTGKPQLRIDFHVSF